MQRERLPVLFAALGLALLLFALSALPPGATWAQGVPPLSPAATVGTAFTYQGQLEKDGSPYTGRCDMQFGLWDAASGGTQVGATLTVVNVIVEDGYFTVDLDFGAGAFTGDGRWLDVAVRCPAGSGSYTTLGRQALRAAPYALALPGLWTQMNNVSPNLIGGYSGNSVADGVTGATIGGGGASGNVNRATGSYATVAGGVGNTAGSGWTTVGGGDSNTASGDYAAVGGGLSNTASKDYAVVSGGRLNTAGGLAASVGGGLLNNAGGDYAAVGGGSINRADGRYATVGGGWSNIASGNLATVGGGVLNHADAPTATIGGGTLISVTGEAATVAGGSHITVTAGYGAVGGGYGNAITASYAVVGGGMNNQAVGRWAVVSGGDNNVASGEDATVGGGTFNVASGSYATVAGGMGNEASGDTATVAGGASNTASSGWSVVGGGEGNTASGELATVGGGSNNVASGYAAVITGGENNVAAGDYSFAAGQRARANHDGAFVWGDSIPAAVNSPTNDTFIVRANNGVWFGQATTDITPTIGSGVFISTSTGAYLSTGGQWTDASDRNLKENFEPVDPQAVLEQVAQLPITTWNYRAEDDSVRHLGPVAQDFYAAFGLGADDTHIAPLDASGVALAAIQGLYQQNQELRAENAQLRARLDELEARLAALEEGRGESSRWQTTLPAGGLLLLVVSAVTLVRTHRSLRPDEP